MDISEEVRAHYSRIGKKGGETTKKKGSEFFRWVRLQGIKKQQMKKEKEKMGIKDIAEIE